MKFSGFRGPDAFWERMNKLSEGVRRSYVPGSVFSLAPREAEGHRVAVADWQFENGPRAVQYSDESGVLVVVATVPDEHQARQRVQEARSEVFPPEHITDDELDAAAAGTTTFSIDGEPVPFSVWSTTTGQVSLGSYRHVWLVVDSRSTLFEPVALIRLIDIEPFLDGWAESIREQRGGI